MIPGAVPIPVAPYSSIGKTLIMDLSCNLASRDMARNIMRVRATSSNGTGLVLDQQFTLTQSASGQAFSTTTIEAPSGNAATVVSADNQVHVVLVTATGTLDMGENTIFVITSPIVSVQVINDLNIANVNVACLII